MARSDRVRRAGAVAVLAVVLLLALTPAAYAASTYFDQTPAVGSVSSVPMPLISVKVSDPAGISTGFQLKIDGVSRTPKVTWGPNRSYCMLSYQQTSPLKNGTHTVYASVFTGAGRTSTTWTFTTRVAPLVGPLVPADGSTTTSQKPTISAGVAPNGVALATYELQVDGVPVAATYDAGTKTVSYTPGANLANDAHHTATLAVTDAAGVATSVTWGFNVQIYADMTDTTGCSDCHVGFPSVHPMDDCMACHGEFSPEPAYWNMEYAAPHGSDYLAIHDCTYCHSSVFPMVPIHTENLAVTHVTTSDMSGCSCHVRSLTVEHARYLRDDGTPIGCVTCHASTDPAIISGMASDSTACSACHTLPPGHPYGEVDHIADVGETADVSGKLCGECHYMDLAAEHGKTTASSATGECATCHPTPREGFGAWEQGCSQGGCHAPGSSTEMHAGAAAAHASPVPAPTCVAAGCHDGDVSVLHSEASTLTAGEVLRTSCSVCHTANVAPIKDCAACHGATPSSGHEAVHELERTDTCVACHEGPSLTAIHMADAAFTCGTCHDSADAEVAAAIAAGTLACSACHVTQGVDYHLGMAAAHRAPVADYETCGHCHHGWGSSPIQGPDIGRHASCTYCHNDTFDLTGKTAHCADCHVTEGAGDPPASFHRQTDAFHSPLDTASMDCARCHETTNVRVLHAEPGCDTCHATYGCSECHSMHYATGGSLGAGLYCARCHDTQGSDYHIGFGAAHTAAASDCTSCHGSVSLVDAHADLVGPDGAYPQYEDTCALCHLNVDPARVPADATAACTSCHASHGADPAAHTAGGPCVTSGCHAADLSVTHATPGCAACHAPGTTPSLICSDCHVGEQHPTADHTSAVSCGACHPTSNLISIHGDDCSACHPTPASTLGAWNQTCEQAGCHASPLHPGVYDHGWDHGEGDDCDDCHSYDSACYCHDYDGTAPVTSSDVRASYTGVAVITLTPTDAGSGVRTTYYQVDGGALQTGTTITIAGPDSGTETHRIEFWSLDNVGNTETPHKSATFTVSEREHIPPVTTSNAVSSYVGPATITLTATDEGGAGVAVTKYRLDGGAEKTGTTVSVPTGAWNTVIPHTLEFWSVDGNANEELPHNVVSFTVSALPDAAAPTGSVTINSGAAQTNTTAVTLRLAATDTGGSGLSQVRFSNDNATWSAWRAYATTTSWTLAGGDGAKTVYAQYRDNAGNVSTSYSDGILLDTTAPTGTIVINDGAGGTSYLSVALTLSASDPDGSGPSQMRFSNDNATWSAWQTYATYKSWSMIAGEGLKTVYVQFRDVAGNTSTSYSDTITFEGGIVGTGITSLTLGDYTWVDADTGASGEWATYRIYVNDVLVGTKAASFDSSWDCPQIATPAGGHIDIVVECGFTYYSWIFDQATPRTFTLTLPSGTTSIEASTWTGFPGVFTDGGYWDDYGDYYAAVYVPNGTIANIVYSYSAGGVDSIAPIGSVSVNGGAAYTNTTAATLTLTADDGGGTGVAEMRFSNDNVTWSAWQTYGTARSWTLTSGNGTKTVYAQYRDVAGNVSTVFSDSITLDGTIPTGSISVNGGAAYATTDLVTLTLSASDAGGSGMGQMRFSNDGTSWSAWEAYAASKSWTLGAGDGAKTVRVQYRDNAGNASATYSDTITLDCTAPTGSISINGGAIGTSSESVMLTLAATDTGGSGMSQMRFSNDGTTWSTWEAYGTSKLWTIESGDGEKTVSVQYRDVAGNVSTPYSDGITLATPSGTMVATSLALTEATWVDANEGATGAWVTYSIYVNDVLIGVKTASSDQTWSCPQIDVESGAHIDIVVDCGFASYQWVFDQDRPNTFTLTLPPGTTRLEAATWTGFPNMYVGTDWWDDYEDMYTAVWTPTGTIGNIAYLVEPGADLTPPTGTIAVNGGVASTNTTAVSLTLSADDGDGAGVAEMRLSNNGTTWTAWEAYATSRSWTLTTGNGAKTVYVQFRDAALNVSASYSDGIVLDGTAPTGSISINGGATSTASTSVTLNLTASDTGGSGIGQMRFSNDNVTWSPWQGYATPSPWTLTAGDGVKTVYAQYRDGAGNVSGTYSDTIALSSTTATLAFVWNGSGYADLHVQDAAGLTIASTSVSGSGSQLSWYVTVPAGQNYYMVCDYFWDDWEELEGGNYGVWTNNTAINPDGVLSPGETVIWNY